eukprot:36651-Eustigmatos_ZCMA.PRE.1
MSARGSRTSTSPTSATACATSATSSSRKRQTSSASKQGQPTDYVETAPGLCVYGLTGQYVPY